MECSLAVRASMAQIENPFYKANFWGSILAKNSLPTTYGLARRSIARARPTMYEESSLAFGVCIQDLNSTRWNCS